MVFTRFGFPPKNLCVHCAIAYFCEIALYFYFRNFITSPLLVGKNLQLVSEQVLLFRRNNPARDQMEGSTSAIRISEGQSTTRPPFFDGSNYPYWKLRMKTWLQANDFTIGLGARCHLTSQRNPREATRNNKFLSSL